MKRIITSVAITSLLWIMLVGWFVHRVWRGTGFWVPPRMEEITTLQPILPVVPGNLFVSLSNQTGKDLNVEGILDGTLSFGGVIIRDMHWGSTSLITTAAPGDHILQVRIWRSTPVVTNVVFSLESGSSNYVHVSIFRDEDDHFGFTVRKSRKALGIM